MTNRERVLAVLNREPPDRIPWMARLGIWYDACKRRGTLPAEYAGLSRAEVERSLGIDESARDVVCYRRELRDVEVRTTRAGDDTLTEYVTPAGTVSTRTRRSAALAEAGVYGDVGIERMIKTESDYAAAEFIFSHAEIVPLPDKVAEYDRKIGERGLPMVWLEHDPMSWIMRELVGLETFFYHLADFPERIESLYEVMTQMSLKIQDAALEAPVRLVLQGAHFEGSMVPPPLFEKYMLPYFRAFADRLHARGKWLVCHADADTRLLVDLIKDAGFDVLDCFASAPLVPFELAEARRRFGPGVTIWGGVPSTILCDPYTDEQFEQYMEHLFDDIAPGDRFMLGVSDNIMPETHIERVRRVGELVRDRGRYPIQSRSQPT
jgi:hypothetical protein